MRFGGYYSSSAGIINHTDEWNGSAWTPRVVPGPLPRGSHAIAFDSARGRVVLFGGSGGYRLADTWEYDGTAWVEVPV